MSMVDFRRGTAAAYAALENKVATTFYLTDDGNLYIGSVKISNAADLQSCVSRVAQNETDITTINATLTKLENSEETLGSVRNIIKGYFDAYTAADLQYTAASGTPGQEGYVPAVSVASAISALETAVGSGGSVSQQIDAAINDLDASVSIVDAGNTNPLNITVTQTDGVLSGVTASIDANTFDSYGSAAAVLGTNADTASDATVYGAKAAAAAAQSDVDALETYVGTIPAKGGDGADAADPVASSVVGYVDYKAAAAASDTTALASRVTANENAITLLNKTDGTVGSVKKTVDDAIAAVVADAPEDFDTLKEMSDWISGHEDDATAMNSAIQANTTAIGAAAVPETSEGAGDGTPATGLYKVIEDSVDAEATRATGVENGLASRLTAVEQITGNTSVATQISNAIGALDTASDVGVASVSNGVVTISGSVKETDGVIAKGTATDVTLAKVATTAAAEDVGVTDTASYFTGTDVEAVLAEIGQRLVWQSI